MNSTTERGRLRGRRDDFVIRDPAPAVSNDVRSICRVADSTPADSNALGAVAVETVKLLLFGKKNWSESDRDGEFETTGLPTFAKWTENCWKTDRN